MKDFHTVLFDLDGTLSNSQEGICKSVGYALEAFGIKETDEEKLKLFIGPPLDEMFMQIYGFTAEQAEAARLKYRGRDEVKGVYENAPYEGISEMLETLHKAGIILGVATSKPEGYAEKILEKDGLLTWFDVVSGADMEGKHVSKTDVLKEAIRRLKHKRLERQENPRLLTAEAGVNRDGREPEDSRKVSGILMVGDRKYDVEGARECGVPCVGVEFGFAPEGELAKAGADYIVGTVQELKGLLLKLAGPVEENTAGFINE